MLFGSGNSSDIEKAKNGLNELSNYIDDFKREWKTSEILTNIAGITLIAKMIFEWSELKSAYEVLATTAVGQAALINFWQHARAYLAGRKFQLINRLSKHAENIHNEDFQRQVCRVFSKKLSSNDVRNLSYLMKSTV